MKKSVFFSIIVLLSSNFLFSQIAINNDGSPPHPSAGLDVNFIDKGFLVPRMTYVQRNAIQGPAEGLMIYCLDCNADASGALSIFQGGSWRIFNLSCTQPNAPQNGNHVPEANQITWDWTNVPIAMGYRWNTIFDPATSIDMGTATDFTETGLQCDSSYTRYVWAYNECGLSPVLIMTQSTSEIPFSPAPTQALVIPESYGILWSWWPISGADGYKWNTTNNPNTATTLAGGSNVTYFESGLTCQTSYTRYVWAYDECGISTATSMTASTTNEAPSVPTAATHVPALNQITWKWHPSTGATGYKWNTTNNWTTAIDMATDTLRTETGLTCNTAYTRYVWAYNGCNHAASITLTQSTSSEAMASPVAGTHTVTSAQITWNWNAVSGATGYKWNTTSNYATATNLGNVLTTTETGLSCNTGYTRYLWAYNACGYSAVATTLSATTSALPASPVAGTHVPSTIQIIWNWAAVPGATGYHFSSSSSFTTYQSVAGTSYTETGLGCNTAYTRYVRAVNTCGNSTGTTLTSTTTANPANPVAATHVPTSAQVTWNWNSVQGASGYRWNTTNNFSTAIALGNVLTYTETGLSCNSAYTRYVWAVNTCGNSTATTLTATTTSNPASPAAATHVPSSTQIIWNWNAVPGATGYRWSATNNYATASVLGNVLTTTETGLSCNTAYTRYVWATNACGYSAPTTLTQTTSIETPPVAGTHVPSATQIVWNWNAVSDATGYKWNTTNNYGTAIDMGTLLTRTETGLTCNTAYTRYVWAYNTCGNSTATTLNQTTSIEAPAAPTPGTPTPSPTQIVWNWNPVDGATGYKWNTYDNYALAINMGTSTSHTETGLTCNTPYTRYVWAYSSCGVSASTALTGTTSLDPPAVPVEATHVATAGQIQWNWNAVTGATGYKWSTTNEYGTATDIGLVTTYTQSGLNCNTPYTSYVWAYSNCGNSTAATLTQTTSNLPPSAPGEGTHEIAALQVTWHWNTVAGATGYKWSPVNDYGSAMEMGTATSHTETGLTCNTPYTRYVWAYSNCGGSTATTLTAVTSLNPPASPSAGTHAPAETSIVWNWNTVSSATGYKWNVSDNYATAIDMGTLTSYTENGLTCNTPYTRYVWAYSNCGVSASATLTQSTSSNPPAAPGAGTHTATASQVIWNWNTVSGATGYKWNTTNNYSTATEMGTQTSHTETGLSCNTAFTRYVWAYGTCGNSTATTLNKSTTNEAPATPTAGTHVPNSTHITWNWNAVTDATGYRWSAVNDFGSATEMGTSTSHLETGLICGTNYTRYAWAYNGCGNSTPVTLNQSTLSSPPATPVAGTHVAALTQITWNWNAVADATGYKWSATNNYGTATDMGTSLSHIETGLSCGTNYTRYVWAYNGCGNSAEATLTQSTTNCWTCGNTLSIDHVAGNVAPVTKSVTYGTVSGVPGAETICWITKNLGATRQATSVSESVEAPAGWYWQFNLKQGYKHDGTTRTPGSTWITSISEYTNWTTSQDPCTIELGTGWRLPSYTEWYNVDDVGGWTGSSGPWGSLLKLHFAGYLYYTTGNLSQRGSAGVYWSSTQSNATNGRALDFLTGSCQIGSYSKPFGLPVRCVKD
jgi:hypothetical protein